MASQDELLVVDVRAWRDWLENWTGEPGAVVLVLAKQGTTEPTRLTYDEALEESLCVGWIDGVRRRRDDRTFLQRFTPRRKGSPWSARNVEIALRLIDVGRMTDAGLAEVERARADGRWDRAYAGQATIGVPEDLAAALTAAPRAQRMFEILTSQNRYAVLYRISAAKRAGTRERRIAQFVEMLADGRTVYPQRRTLPD